MTTADPGSRDRNQHPGRWRSPVIIAGIVLLGGLLIAWLQPPAQPSGYLDPASTGPTGGHALAAILAQRGEQLTTTRTPPDASQGQPQRQAEQTTILITSPWLLTQAQLNHLSQTTANLVLTDPDPVSLAALAPDVKIAATASIATLPPGCTLPAATLAGDAELGGTALDGTALTSSALDVQLCYVTGGYPSLVSYTTGGRRITVLGTGAPLTNQNLANAGNAALAINLLTQQRVIWLAPAVSPAAAPAGGQVSVTSLLPKPVYMVTVQLVIVVLLLALWRARRLGPVVPERLPAVVRAAETTEGHGRLYQARRARDQAAQVLREAAARRMTPQLGLPSDATPATTAAALAQKTGDPADNITQTLSGPPPANDAALVQLADRLDELERKAGAR